MLRHQAERQELTFIVTILTVGFGDLTLRNDLGRALIFPYTVGGIIMLGLVISSISKFASEMSQDNVVRKHFERIRTRTLERTTTDPGEFHRMTMQERMRNQAFAPISSPSNMRQMHKSIGGPNHMEAHFGVHQPVRYGSVGSGRRDSIIPPIRRRTNLREAVKLRHKKVRLLREERDRFDEMRRIQHMTQRFKRYWALSLSVLAFAILWLMGAVIFWLAERKVQGMSYFQSLYFCYVSLLTIGYGDFAPRSNAGRPFFVVWSLIAVPTITLLINDMGSTVIESFKRGTFIAADWTILLRRGIWADFLKKNPRFKAYLKGRKEKKAREKRMQEGIGPPVEDDDAIATVDSAIEQNPSIAEKKDPDNDLEHLAKEITKDTIEAPTEAMLARHLSLAIRRVATDITDPERKYSFEEWAELTRLIRFTGKSAKKAQKEEEEDVIDWDWLGDQSPMMANMSEPEFVMEKLCESLARNMKRMEKYVEEGKREIERLRRHTLETETTVRRRSHFRDDANDNDES
jgi:potassium channel subfamily K